MMPITTVWSTREEMEAGLKADFAAADTNGDGCLGPAEVRAENDRRLARDATEASPLVDWNLDGCVDAREFGNTLSFSVHSYFDLSSQTDRNGRVSQVDVERPLDADSRRATGCAYPDREWIFRGASTTQDTDQSGVGLALLAVCSRFSVPPG
jgi:hypothetical protein